MKKLFAIAKNPEEAQISQEALEHGLDGVVLKVEDVAAVLKLKVALSIGLLGNWNWKGKGCFIRCTEFRNSSLSYSCGFVRFEKHHSISHRSKRIGALLLLASTDDGVMPLWIKWPSGF
ncbi:hypothetical protein Nepgr_028573 [Nepenthes gracilis]|uniref:3-dehydroquinate synthase N-terminal domain-containing protein n=1 Tax=Nepenthes gracilis TaxID=150966 RepID=A0AAD3Y432_NEPGR|nr:hypothetical protein Nepgr_028573 [Nepenthes gracilis]